MWRAIERGLLAVLVVLMAIQTYFVVSIYNTVQAQSAKVAALESRIEREVTAARTEAEARIKRIEDEVGRLRSPLGR